MDTAVYSWAKTFNAASRGVSLNEQPDAQIVGQVIQGIQDKNGSTTPETLLEASRPKRAATHKIFEWDDEVASEKYRLEQARLVLRSIQIEVKLPDDGVRSVKAFINVPDANKKKVYIDTKSVMSDHDMQTHALQAALNSLIAWRRRWAELTMIADSLELVDAAIRKTQAAMAETS